MGKGRNKAAGSDGGQCRRRYGRSGTAWMTSNEFVDRGGRGGDIGASETGSMIPIGRSLRFDGEPVTGVTVIRSKDEGGERVRH